MAAELSSARETISRLLKDFERQGALELGRGQIRLLDEPLLRKLQNRA
ncbi:MAG: helix-turn-helix domain-containing protein [Acidobacteriota bacterium]|nr:helix-turn-helix domain-containing protein [Acidobacteriota bacterium]